MIKNIFNIRNPVFVKIFHIRIFLTKITIKGYFSIFLQIILFM